MINYLASKFIKRYKETEDPVVQAEYISLSGSLGLALNLVLFISKLVVGFVTNSIAIISDSFNNLSDSLTSVIAIIGGIASKQPADKEHPQGHGRYEYVASLFVSMIIMYVGFELFKNSVIKIRHPEDMDFNVISVGVLLFSNIVKIYMYSYNSKLAKRFDSTLNDGVAKDSLNDVIATTGILIAGAVSVFLGKNLDGIAGVLISILVFKTGLEFASSTISVLVGEQPSEELIESIVNEVEKGKYIKGYHDLIVHNYGRGKIIASIHVEIPIDISVVEIHNIIDGIERAVLNRTGVELVIHMDPSYSIYEQYSSEDMDLETKVVDIIDMKDDYFKLESAAKIIKSGGLVAMPTETVYGLAADGLNPEAVQKIFDVKQRPADNPLILHVSSVEEVEPLVTEISDKAKLLMDKLWPGPLTIVFKKSDLVPDIITAGADTVAIRLPDNEIARALIKLSGTPIAAPSANISGRPSPTNAIDVFVDLNGKIDMILDGGGSKIGIESTVVDVVDEQPKILRPGYYGYDTISKLIPEVSYDRALVSEGEVPRSPGQKYRHYAPKAELHVYSASLDNQIKRLQDDIAKYKAEDKKVGIMTFTEHMPVYDADVILNVGSIYDLEEMARMLFSKLRDFDRMGVDIILVEGVEETGLGFAIMNRLRKSAGNKVIEE